MIISSTGHDRFLAMWFHTPIPGLHQLSGGWSGGEILLSHETFSAVRLLTRLSHSEVSSQFRTLSRDPPSRRRMRDVLRIEGFATGNTVSLLMR
jgi:hypothetical protein